MRVITGSARGRKLQEPDGLDIRPTTDRVKEGLFSAIQFDIPGRRVLDLFAGTGQLGIECLSRGADSAVFVDTAPAAVAAIRENLKRTGFTDRAEIHTGGALEYLAAFSRARGKNKNFDIIFLDPPYESNFIADALEAVAAFDILKPHGIISAEHPAGKRLPPPPERFRAYRSYRYGKIAVTLYRHADADLII